MPTVLIVHHTPSPSLQELLETVRDGASTDELDDVEVVVRPALTCPETDVLEADGYVLGTPANLGSMSGALKHFLDRIYYPCLEATQRRPFGLYVHGNSDTGGAVRDVGRIVTGLAWREVVAPVEVTGAIDTAAREAAWELGARVAVATVDPTAG